ncbi:NCS2 family permease [Odoribacter sp. AF15-53]|uniref:NCS2 family permease n=1 Tax=Odoribacter sp. AF15-53 TaxID=2292236 RepID=UPI000E4E3010|nr:NCS2 family permease [Odoribacter sp. AF15-53]RHR82517.1 NCS2 family permease [Odoribacter sp. AF15-53]
MILKKLFGFDPGVMKVKTEIMAGVTTFLTMSYILAVNPDILSAASMDKGAVFTATALAASIATLVMAIMAKLPFALAPGMGLNAFFAFTLVQGMGFSWEAALAAVFIEGVVFILLTVFNVRELIVNAIPETLRHAISVGIGLFIAFLGLQKAGLIVADPATFVSLGEFTPSTLLAVGGIVIGGVLVARKVRGALFYAILIVTVLSIPLGVTRIPENFSFVSLPHSLEPVFFKLDFHSLLSVNMLVALFSLVFMDIFDTLGTLVGTANKVGMVKPDGSIPKLKPAMMADAIGTTVGALLGTSTTTTYAESTAGIAEGGRSGLTAAVVCVLFLVALFFSPFFLLVPGVATAGVLVIVGSFMFDAVVKIRFSDFTEAFPAFVTIIMMPLTYSIAEGIVLGLLAYVSLKLFTGKHRELNLTMYILAILCILKYVI